MICGTHREEGKFSVEWLKLQALLKSLPTASQQQLYSEMVQNQSHECNSAWGSSKYLLLSRESYVKFEFVSTGTGIMRH